MFAFKTFLFLLSIKIETVENFYIGSTAKKESKANKNQPIAKLSLALAMSLKL
jgi:hypothetical protein